MIIFMIYLLFSLQRVIVDRFYTKVYESEIPDSIKDVSERMFKLYGLWSLEKHLATLFQGWYCFKKFFVLNCIRFCFKQTFFTTHFNSWQRLQIPAEQETYTLPILMQIHALNYSIRCLEKCMLWKLISTSSRRKGCISRELASF